MEERERVGRLSPEIYVYATNKNFVNIYDALRINKIKLEIAGYDPDTNRQTGHATAWLDGDDMRLLAHLVCHRLFREVTGGKWQKFGGSARDDGNLESRNLLIEWDEGEGGRFARFPYRITVANGPGKKTATGGVAPAGEPTARMSMRVPEQDMIKMMLVIRDYIIAHDTAHHHRLVADKIRELRERLEGRAERQVAPAERRGDPAEVGTATRARPQLRQVDGELRRGPLSAVPSAAPAGRPNTGNRTTRAG